MTPLQWARVFRAGATSMEAVPDDATPPDIQSAVLVAMAEEAEQIAAETR